MEFSFNLSEAEYLQAWKLRRKGRGRPRVVKTILFWVFVLVCLLLLWTVVQHNSQRPAGSGQPETVPQVQIETPGSGSTALTVAINVGPFLAMGGIFAFVLFRLGPTTLRRLYRKDPSWQGTFTVNVTEDSISGQNTAGTSWQSGWNLYEEWREGKDLIVLMYRSSAFFVLNLAGLSEAQRAELRGILSAALPKK